MAYYLRLLDKTSNDAVSLISIDERICREVYNVEPDDTHWGSSVFNWYDTIGFSLSSGMTIKEVRDHYVTSDIWTEERPMIMQVLDFLEANYVPKSSYGR